MFYWQAVGLRLKRQNQQATKYAARNLLVKYGYHPDDVNFVNGYMDLQPLAKEDFSLFIGDLRSEYDRAMETPAPVLSGEIKELGRLIPS